VATIAVDFDGVIHAYSKGWQDGTIYDEPLPGALTSLRVLMQHAAVFIHTSRQAEQVVTWLVERGMPCRIGFDGEFWNERGLLLVTNRKLPAAAYIDDRAIRFTNWFGALSEVEERGTLGIEVPSRAEIIGILGKD
jgi:hypothetical protein